jgi:N6-adenosine-specific RNA methylase IME4
MRAVARQTSKRFQDSAGLSLYDRARRALAEARSVDEVKEIHDQAAAMAEYARRANDRALESDAVALRMMALRGLNGLMERQSKTVGLAKGGGGKHGRKRVIEKPTLKATGIDKNLAHQARTLGRLTDAAFDAAVTEARSKVGRALRKTVRDIEAEEERAVRRARTEAGDSVDDLRDLIRAGSRFGAIMADPPWPYETWSERGGTEKSAERHYQTQSIEWIQALPVAQLAADDSALFLWIVRAHLPAALAVIASWGFEYRTLAFNWIKSDSVDIEPPLGMGFWTRSGSELCLLATRGKPKRLDAGVREVITARRAEHSRKPDAAAKRIERLVGGPYLELFARRPRAGWRVWGDEITFACQAAE